MKKIILFDYLIFLDVLKPVEPVAKRPASISRPVSSLLGLISREQLAVLSARREILILPNIINLKSLVIIFN